MTILHANTELVAVAWLSGVNGISPAMVGTTVPEDNSTWAASGFLQVEVLGGTPGFNLPWVNPVVRVHSWANTGTSKKVPWGKAANLLELVRDATYVEAGKRRVTLPSGFPQARVAVAGLVGEPHRVPADTASYAHYYVDMQMNWLEVAA
jgi:hypothetical protein